MKSFWFHIGDYTRDTRGLSILEDGVYRRLLDAYYDGEGPLALDADAVAREIGARDITEILAVDNVLNRYFERTADGWVHHRVEAEIAKYNAYRQKKAASGKMGGMARAKNAQMSTLIPKEIVASLKQTQGIPIPIEVQDQKQKTKPLSAAPTSFAEFWAAYPAGERKVDKAKCETVWKAKHLDACIGAVLSGLTRWKQSEKWRNGYIEAPLVFLRNDRWTVDLTPAAQGQSAPLYPHVD